MKNERGFSKVLILLAMLAVFLEAYFADRLFDMLRHQASETFNVNSVLWANYGLGFLTVLLVLLLALWALAGSTRSPLVHWVFLVVGLLISFYIPLVMTGALSNVDLRLFSQATSLLGANVVQCARILAVAGLLGLLLKPRRTA